MPLSENPFSFKKNLKRTRKINHRNDHLDGSKLYVINYSNIKERFREEIEKYMNYPELIDIDEFSSNYVFGYHFYHNIDDLQSKEAMFLEVTTYLRKLKLTG